MGGIVALRGLGYLLVGFFALSSNVPGLILYPILLCLIMGIELEWHLQKRTTASYSSSDRQHQWVFNRSILCILIIVPLMLGVHLLGFKPGFTIDQLVDTWHANWFFNGLLLIGFGFLLRNIYLTISHHRTILDLISRRFA